MVEIVQVDEEKLAKIVELWNPIWPDYAVTADELRHRIHRDASMRSRFWLACVEDESAGVLEIGPVSGSSHPRRWTFHIAVREDLRNEGIGAALYDFARSVVAASKPLFVVAHVHEGDASSMRFAEKRGFKEDKRDFVSTLDLTRIELEDIEIRVAPAASSLVYGSGVDSVDFRHRLHELFEEVRKDIPRSFPPTPLTFEQFEEGFIEPSFSWTMSAFALHGERPIGFSTVFESAVEGQLIQGLTAVSKEFRGLGVAKMLKMKVIEAGLQNGYRSIITDNDTRNAPMIAINEKLGFQKQPGVIHYLWRADES